jgi:hypothetical protein
MIFEKSDGITAAEFVVSRSQAEYAAAVKVGNPPNS